MGQLTKISLYHFLFITLYWVESSWLCVNITMVYKPKACFQSFLSILGKHTNITSQYAAITENCHCKCVILTFDTQV